MKKAVLSNRIYMNASPELLEELEEELTHVLPNSNPKGDPIVIKQLGYTGKDIISIPIGRQDLIPQDYEIVDRRVAPEAEFPQFKFELREDQEEVLEECEDNCIINAYPGWGKTFTAIAIAAKKYQVKTLVVTHTVALRDQWAKEVEKSLGIKAGIIGSGKYDIDSPIVIGNIQTLVKLAPKLKYEFGLVWVDECHRTPADSFIAVLENLAARWKMGLSGTLRRKDGKHVLLPSFFSDHIIIPKKTNVMEPVIHRYFTQHSLPGTPRTPWARRINKLMENGNYASTVISLANAYAEKGYKVLVVADRVQFLKTCAEVLEDSSVCVTGQVADLSEREELVNSVIQEKSILFGTTSIFSEGISIPPLSCLILGSPINNESLLTQLAARINRKMEGKKQPVVVDIVMRDPTSSRQAESRLGVYIQEGWEIKNAEI